jgi:hypothetical protein
MFRVIGKMLRAPMYGACCITFMVREKPMSTPIRTLSPGAATQPSSNRSAGQTDHGTSGT